MGAVAKNPIPQLTPTAAQPVPRRFLNDSLATMRVIGLTEVQQLSQYLRAYTVTDSLGTLTILQRNHSAEGANVPCKRLSGANALKSS